MTTQNPEKYFLILKSIIKFDYESLEGYDSFSSRDRRSTDEDYESFGDQNQSSTAPAQNFARFLQPRFNSFLNSLDIIDVMINFVLSNSNSYLSLEDLENYGCWCQLEKYESYMSHR